MVNDDRDFSAVPEDFTNVAGARDGADDELTVRIARAGDAPALLEIYAPYVLETTVTFEEEVPTGRDFCSRISYTLEKYPYLVAESAGRIVGYAYAGEYKGRAAYDWSVEATVYVAQGCEGRVVGGALYKELERYLRLQNVVNLTACITAENEGSIAFHRHCGYEMVGIFAHLGFKFDRWLDVAWMQKSLLSPEVAPAEFQPFPTILSDE